MKLLVHDRGHRRAPGSQTDTNCRSSLLRALQARYAKELERREEAERLRTLWTSFPPLGHSEGTWSWYRHRVYDVALLRREQKRYRCRSQYERVSVNEDHAPFSAMMANLFCRVCFRESLIFLRKIFFWTGAKLWSSEQTMSGWSTLWTSSPWNSKSLLLPSNLARSRKVTQKRFFNFRPLSSQFFETGESRLRGTTAWSEILSHEVNDWWRQRKDSAVARATGEKCAMKRMYFRLAKKHGSTTGSLSRVIVSLTWFVWIEEVERDC